MLSVVGPIPLGRLIEQKTVKKACEAMSFLLFTLNVKYEMLMVKISSNFLHGYPIISIYNLSVQLNQIILTTKTKEYIARPLVCGSIHLKNSGENKSPEFPYTPPDLSEKGDLTVQFVLRPKIM